MVKEKPEISQYTFEHEPTPEERAEILRMQGEKGVERVITDKDRRRDKKEADRALEAARRKIMGETKEGQQEMFRE